MKIVIINKENIVNGVIVALSNLETYPIYPKE